MHNQAPLLDKNFITKLKTQTLPEINSSDLTYVHHLNKEAAISIFESQLFSRKLDIIARELKAKGLCYYTIGSSGHEGNAAYSEALNLNDTAFLHYRSAAFFAQRAKKK